MTAELDRAALRSVVALLEPLTALGDPDDLASLLDASGWDASVLGISASAVGTEATALDTSMEAATGVADQQRLELSDVAASLGSVGGATIVLLDAAKSAQTATGVPTGTVEKLTDDLLAFLLEHYLASRLPRGVLVASLLGFVKPAQRSAILRADGQEIRRLSVRRVADLTALATAIRDPLAYVRGTFLLTPQGVARAAEAIADLVGPTIADDLVGSGMAASYGVVPIEPGLSLTAGEQAAAAHLLLVDAVVPGPSAGTTIVLRVAAGLTDDTNQEGLGLLLGSSGEVSLSRSLANGMVTLTFKGAQQPVLITSKSVRLASGATTPVTLEVGVEYTSSGPGAAARFGSPTATRLQLDKIEASVAVDVEGSTVDIIGALDLTGLLLAIQGGDGDGFLARALPKDPIELEGDLGIDLSLRKGVHVRGRAGLEWRRGIGKTIGPLEIQEVQVALDVADDVRLHFGAGLGVQLGPIRASVDGLGIAARLREPPAGAAANFGPFELLTGFQPPRGLGIGVDAGPVVGGGFIFFDPANGRYGGLLQLAIAKIQIKAIGLLDTRLPGGQQGYSFLIIVSAEFPPIQLGFGFTLNGVGGLAGIQRTMVVDALQAGIRNHSVDHILFPDDPIRDAPQIISDLQTIFPPQQGRYVFGPMAIIGYGSPTLVEAELGIILEVPAPVRLVLLGQINAAFPEKKKPVLELHLDVLGIVEFSKRTLSLDAVLHDSKLKDYPLSGDMALRANFGDQPNFALAIGGFNPRFTPPPAFPALRRLTLSISQGNDVQIVLQSYVAMTSNSFQFGARGDITANELGFGISGWLGFDVLVVISPFSFVADVTAGVEVRKGQVKIASVSLEASLTGPTPWHLSGTARFDFIIPVSVPIELTVGEEAKAEISPVDPWPLLQTALEDARNWSAVPSPAAFHVCSLREPDTAVGPLLDPLGGAQVHQKVCPLNRRLDRFGEAPPANHSRFDLKSVAPSSTQPTVVQDYFAPAQFDALSDAEKLSRPGFEKMDAGFTLAADQIEVGIGIGDSVSFDTTIVDAPDGVAIGDPLYTPKPGNAYAQPSDSQAATLGGAAGGRSPLLTTGEERYAPPPDHAVPAKLADETFLIVDRDTLREPTPQPPRTSGKGAAFQALDEYLRAHRERRGTLQVIPEHEAQAA